MQIIKSIMAESHLAALIYGCIVHADILELLPQHQFISDEWPLAAYLSSLSTRYKAVQVIKSKKKGKSVAKPVLLLV